MSMAEDDRPKTTIAHEIGADLSQLSADELTARIGLLEAEIQRLTVEKQEKMKGRAAAEDFFKRK